MKTISMSAIFISLVNPRILESLAFLVNLMTFDRNFLKSSLKAFLLEVLNESGSQTFVWYTNADMKIYRYFRSHIRTIC